LKAGKTQAPASDRSGTDIAEPDATLHDLVFELGLWVRGLEVFCATERHVFPPRTGAEQAERNYRVEFQITHAVFIKCSELIAAIHRTLQGDAFTQHAIAELNEAISSLVALNNSIRQNATLNFVEWNAWCKMVAERLAKTSMFATFDSELAANGRRYLPEKLERLIDDGTLSLSDRTDLKRYLPRFGGILRVLDVVKGMLDRDEPLRPALVIFAFLHESIEELNFDINNRLLRSPDENAEMFVMLDAASYSLSMESKKAFSQELAGISAIRSAITVFARVEAAHGVLNDNLRMLLTGFLRLTETGAPEGDVFPEFTEKLERSLQLRLKLWEILCTVRLAESDPTDEAIAKLQTELDSFLQTPLSYLFYKDRETFERFCKEISITTAGPDAGPVLHRFSAYTETLFNQVGMRAVLQNHPFELVD